MALQQALQQQREHEQQVKQAALGNADNIEFGSGIVKLYKAEGKKMNWVEQGVGMLVWWSSKFGDEQRFRCLRISDMHPILDEELYDNFDENYTCTKTKRGTHFFHTMEFEHDVWGLCFAREADASNFAQKIKIMAPKGDPKGGGKKDKKKEKEKKEGGGGWFGGGKKKEKERESSREEEPAMQIGMPTNFKHVTHIGWDEANGQTRRSPFARRDEDDAQEDEDAGERPRRGPFGGLPDLRESIHAAVANAIERSDLRHLSEIPRKRDLDALNDNLERVAAAIERLEDALRDKDPS